MRVLCLFLSLCAFIPVFSRGASINYAKSGLDGKNDYSKLSKEGPTIAVKQTSVADTVATVNADSDANADADVVFVSGEDVANNFSGKSQNQIFNQIVPLANVKDFYGEWLVHHN